MIIFGFSIKNHYEIISSLLLVTFKQKLDEESPSHAAERVLLLCGWKDWNPLKPIQTVMIHVPSGIWLRYLIQRLQYSERRSQLHTMSNCAVHFFIIICLYLQISYVTMGQLDKLSPWLPIHTVRKTMHYLEAIQCSSLINELQNQRIRLKS